VAKGAGIVFSGMIAGNLLGMVNQILLGRFLGPENYGLFNLALSVVMIASSISVFGFFGSLARFIPYHLKRNEAETVKSVIDFSSVFVLSIGFIFAAFLYIFSGKIAVSIFHEPRLEQALKIFSVGVPVFGMQSVMRGIFRGFKAVKYDALIFNIIDRIAKITFFLISLAFIYKLYGALIAFTAGVLSTVIVSFWLIRRRVFPDYHKFRRTPVARELLSFSWPLALTGFSFLFVSKTDKIMLGYFMTSQDVGIYMPALVLSNLLIFVATAFKYIFLPVVSEFFTRNDISGLGKLYKSTSKWIFMVVLPLFLLILLFPKEILTILYGSEYVGGYIALVILSLGIAMNDFAGTAGNILVGGGHTKLNLACEIIAAVTNVLLNIILIPLYGIAGAAIATGISYITRNISSLSFVYRAYRIHPYKSNYIGFLFSGFVSAAIVYVIKIFSPLSWWLNVFVLGAVFIVVYLFLSLVSRSFDDNDRVILEAVERKAGIKLDFIKKFV